MRATAYTHYGYTHRCRREGRVAPGGCRVGSGRQGPGTGREAGGTSRIRRRAQCHPDPGPDPLPTNH
eukprot:scaffold39115_cov65-Phaeocystis_antarctica.AAC.1